MKLQQRHHRRSIRLKGYDYRQAGAYFVTICTYQREMLFSRVDDGELILNEFGVLVQQAWEDLVTHYHHVDLDAFVVMPNHVHGIIVLTDDERVGAGLKPAPTRADDGESARAVARKRHGLPEIVRGFKTFSARRINRLRRTPGLPVWQRNYYEHIVRSERALNAIRRYIAGNPDRWAWDRYNPAAAGPDPEAVALWQRLQADAR
ncbi:MAG: transposase [Anaerolineae bacterium]|jgi:REP element-mobilizing transposase RayT